MLHYCHRPCPMSLEEREMGEDEGDEREAREARREKKGEARGERCGDKGERSAAQVGQGFLDR